MKKILLALITLASSLSYSAINYHGRVIQQSNNLPISSTNVRFKFQIKSSTCVVYEENHDNINMSSSNGYFSLNIGNGTPEFGTFDNSMKVDGSSVNCKDGGSVALSTSSQKSLSIQILDYDGSNYSSSLAVINNLSIGEVPVSIASKTLEGKPASSFIQSTGNVSQSSIQALADGSSSTYVTPSGLSSAISSLGLGTLSTLNSVSDSNILSLSWSKLTGIPSSFTPSSHSHAIGDVLGLQSALDGKVSTSKLSLNCSASQTVQYISVSDSYQCQSIAILSSQISGLGSLATLNSVTNSQITSLEGTKLTGSVKVGNSDPGGPCTITGMMRYNDGLQICEGGTWNTLAVDNYSGVPVISNWVSYTPTTSNLGSGSLGTNFGKWRRNGDQIEVIIYQIKDGITGTGSSAVTWSIPSGFTVDTSKLPYGNTGSFQNVGTLLVANSGLLQSVNYLPSSNAVYSYNNGGQWNGSSFQANGNITLRFSLPIVDWESSTSQVAVYSPPVVAQISGSPGSVATNTVITGNSTIYDSNSAILSSSRFTCPFTGYYRVHGVIRLGAAGNATAYIFKNGIVQSELTGLDNNLGKSFSGSVQCNSGQILDVRPNNTVTIANFVTNFELIK